MVLYNFSLKIRMKLNNEQKCKYEHTETGENNIFNLTLALTFMLTLTMRHHFYCYLSQKHVFKNNALLE